MTQPDFRALCAELLLALETEGYTHWTINPDEDPLCERARTALATPPPEPPTDEELVAFLYMIDPDDELSDLAMARAVLERWGHD
jgi:hypothetical protein